MTRVQSSAWAEDLVQIDLSEVERKAAGSFLENFEPPPANSKWVREKFFGRAAAEVELHKIVVGNSYVTIKGVAFRGVSRALEKEFQRGFVTFSHDGEFEFKFRETK